MTDKKNSTINLTNKTLDDRFRRLIPYMTFYIPTNDYQSHPSQTYSFMPVDTVSFALRNLTIFDNNIFFKLAANIKQSN